MRILIPILACLLLVGGCEKKQEVDLHEMDVRIEPVGEDAIHPCQPETVHSEKTGLAEFTFSANSNEFWGRNKIWLPIERLNTEAIIKESECEIMEWRSDILCTTCVLCWCIWLDEILYYVLENPFDKLGLDTVYLPLSEEPDSVLYSNEISPDTVYLYRYPDKVIKFRDRMPEGQWVTVKVKRYEVGDYVYEMDGWVWVMFKCQEDNIPDSVFILSNPSGER